MGTQRARTRAAAQSHTHTSHTQLSEIWMLIAKPVSHIMSKKHRIKKLAAAPEKAVEQVDRTEKKIGLKTMATVVSLVHPLSQHFGRSVKEKFQILIVEYKYISFWQ